jgi:GWxTD domain-containing protein
MFWNRVVRMGAGGALLALAVIPSTSAATRTPSDEIIFAWRDGPPRYLMTTQEDQAVRAMKTVPELAHFVTAFWARRDPTPGTLENEYRRTYWTRVLEADQLFRDSTTPGWKTDRGKVYILLGAPDSVETDDSPSFLTRPNDVKQLDSFERDPNGTHRGLERWAYTPRAARNSESEFFVAFVRDASLDWKLSSDPDLIQPNFPGSVTADPNDAQYGGMDSVLLARSGALSAAGKQSPELELARVFPTLDTSLFINYDLGLEIAVPQTPELAITTVTTREFLSAFPATPRFEFFRARDGSTFVSVGALVKSTDLYAPGTKGTSTLRLYAGVAPAAGSRTTRYAGNDGEPRTIDLSQGPAPGGVFDAWTGLALPPGRYHATLAIEDSLTGRIGRSEADIDVPDFSGSRLALSTLVLASDLSDTGERLGVTARSSGIFLRSESLGVYYEVYGLPGGDAARFSASYRFFREDAGGGLAPVGKPIVLEDRNGAAQGWSIPLSKWPPGRYRMEVTVTGEDHMATSKQIPFEVLE